MEWMVKYDQLDDDQKDFVDKEINKPGNVWVQGFAGSGKSVMLIHALRKKLASNPSAKVCVVVFTHSLLDMFRTGMAEIGIGSIPVMTYYEFDKGTERYDYVFCDEVQDLPEDILNNMKSRSQHVFVAGDSNQSIYENRVDSDDIEYILNARPFILTRIYRLTRSIMNAVSRLLPQMDIFGSRRDMTKKDISIRIGEADNIDEEVEYIVEQAMDAAAEGYSAVILLPKHDYIIDFVERVLSNKQKNQWQFKKDRYGKPDYRSLNQHLSSVGIKMEYIGNGYGSLQNASRNRNIILMTYHSSKGMDFDNVFLPYLSDDLNIARTNEETLLMVAMTRSKMNLFITYTGYLHPLVQRFESTCQKISLNSSDNGNSTIDFDF